MKSGRALTTILAFSLLAVAPAHAGSGRGSARSVQPQRKAHTAKSRRKPRSKPGDGARLRGALPTKAKKSKNSKSERKKARRARRRVTTKRMTPRERQSAKELSRLLRRASAKELRDKAFEPDYAYIDKAEAAKLPKPKPGHIRLANGAEVPAKSNRARMAFKALKRNPKLAKKRARKPRRVLFSGGGPTGTLGAIQAYHLGMDVTIVETRDKNTLPIVWNNRQESRDILALIDPQLERTMRRPENSAPIRSGEVLERGKDPVLVRPKLRPADPNRAGNQPLGIGSSTSVYQTQAKREVEVYWARLKQLEKAERRKAAKEGRKPRLTIYRGYEVAALPKSKGKKRSVKIRNKKTGKTIKIKRPDDIFIAEGANSATRKMAGAEFVDVGPNTRFVAGWLEGIHIGSTGGGQRGVARRGFREDNGVALRQIALSPANENGIWALPEVPARLDFDSPASIKAYFGRSMSKEAAVEAFYVREIAPLLGVKPEVLKGKFSFGPGPFVLQSHVAGPVAKDARNVHLIGDARGNSHFLTSLGKVTGTGTHQMSMRRYWTALSEGANQKLSRAILDRRLDAGTRAWLKLGLREFTTRGGVNLGSGAVNQLRQQSANSNFSSNGTSAAYDAASDPTVNNH
ncbi:MAG: NAD(P)/FAD-dependent oxidoreductase [Deltaproteobacteria bacterium]|nr:NAD(P)/FAD-dependent oxidoreductase [Deltaproteobacteria bacterium]